MNKIFNPKIYIEVPYDDLVVFALFSITQKKLDPTFENLVVECYLLFPERFGLPGYIKKYPDSAQVEKSWLRCRTDKNLITGDKARGFDLTVRGLEVVHKTEKRLGSKTIDTKKLLSTKGDKRTKNGRLVKQLEDNKLFKEFKDSGRGITISDYEFCDLIYSTLDALPESRRKNLQQLKNTVAGYNRKDMLNFLNFCENKFMHLLFSNIESKKRYEGGMMKKKNYHI
ncbi:hypothetical protein HY311_00855 [Candidatus Nomurabacteria bacterium]|nr:hypothetical protein [Candidatus Nomurabacteria bacterium]